MENSLNSVTVVGRVAQPLKPRTLPTGMQAATMALAVHRVGKVGGQIQERTSFVDVELFGRTAENALQHLRKGRLVGVQGFLQQDRWPQGSQTRSKVYVVGEKLMFLPDDQQIPQPPEEPPCHEDEEGDAPPPPRTGPRPKPLSAEAEDIPF